MFTPQPAVALALREDLRLYKSGSDRDGAPVWVIQDPVTNRFYKIGWFEYECLLRWPNEPARIAQDIRAETPIQAQAEHVQAFATFLEANRLVRPSPEGLNRLKQQANAPGWRHWRWWLHNYLFFRVPLVHPDRMLVHMLRWLGPLFTRTALWIVIALTLLGLILVMRQWDVFTHSVMDLITPSGIVGFAIALLVSKTLHELGHALVATRQGLRVGHMGVAFLVLWPMLYTDTGESWRLASHRQRLAISIAGISTELALAGLATLAWTFLDDGVLRQAMLYLATTAWVLSLALNVSPFMRFDGYYILSDILDFPNLHERAGEVARITLRRVVLGLKDPYPAQYSPRAKRFLTAFAYTTWLYRLLVFLGIAWMVYALFFKVLGIFLMIVEIFWFVMRPISGELQVWRKRWPEVSKRRKLTLWSILILILTVITVPWPFNVRTDALAHPVRSQIVYAPESARIQTLSPNGAVKQGELLASLEIPERRQQRERIQASLDALESRLSGLMGDATGDARYGPILRQIRERTTALEALDSETARLIIKAPFTGEWLDVDSQLAPGVWVDPRTPLGIVVDNRHWEVDAYVNQHDVSRLASGALARFYFADAPGGVSAEVEFIEGQRTSHLSHILLDDQYGGPIATRPGSSLSTPSQALYRVRLQLESPLPSAHEIRGRVVIEGTHKSLLWQGIEHLASIVIRESGF